MVVTLLSSSATATAQTTALEPSLDGDARAGDEGRRTFYIEQSLGLDMRMDGRLDEPAWDNALEVSLDWEWLPGDGVEPPVRTVAKLLFDSTHLYVAFRAFDPEPQSIRAHFMDRDEIGTFVQDDHVTFMIDTYDSQRRAFQFRVNPYGVQADAIFSQIDGIEDFSWDMIWTSAGRIDTLGWVAEIAIPFNQLRFAKGDGPQAWGFDFSRSYPRNVRHRISANLRDRDNACTLCQVPRVIGFEGIESGLNIEVVPTVTVNRIDRPGMGRPGIDGGLEDGDEEVEAGLTLRWSPTPSLTLNAAVNPDFSQVEADIAQLAVNERFALFFPEKRPFFLEAVDLFATQIPAVFTRTIIDPEWGLKATGKRGANSYGLFTAHDNLNNILVPGNNFSRLASVDGEVTTSVARWRRDVGGSSALGALYTGREGDRDYYNRVAGVDGFIRFDGANSVQFQGLFSETQYPDALAASLGDAPGDFGGHAAEGIYFHNSRNWQGSLGYRNFGTGFRSDAGFLPRADFETWRGNLARVFWGGEDDWYDRAEIGTLVISTRDQNGRLTDQVFEINGAVNGPLQSTVGFEASLQDQIAGGVLFRDLPQWEIFGEIQPSGSVRLELDIEGGEEVDFTNVQVGDSLEINPEIEVKIGDHLNAQVDVLQQDLDVAGGRLFRARLAQMEVVYQWNVRTFVRGIFQYLDVDHTPELYLGEPPEDVEEFFAQLLFSYKINPQTVLFLGYSDTRQGFAGARLDRADRALFLKLGYAWIH